MDRSLGSLEVRFCASLRGVIEQLEKLGIVSTVIGTLRSVEEQDRLYAQGRSAPGPVVTHARGGQSYHNFGLACDLMYSPPYSVWGDGLRDAVEHVAVVAGLTWGGTWRFLDEAHWEDRRRGCLATVRADRGLRPES